MAASRGLVKIFSRLPSRQCFNSTSKVQTLEAYHRSYSTPLSSSILNQSQHSHSTEDAKKKHYLINGSIRQISTSDRNQTDAETVVNTEEDEGSFDKYGISPETQYALRAHGIEKLFPVQFQGFQYIQAGRDVVVKARTGTGKTLAFALPLVEKLLDREKRRGDKPKAIVLTPTRELAIQVEDHTRRLNRQTRITCVYGGSAYGPQEKAIYNGLDIVVGTPGRLKDMIDKGILNLEEVEHVILDEVDRMLDMGFQDVVDQILSSCYTVSKPQTLMFSATVPPYVKKAARKYLSEDVLLIDLIGDQNIQSATTVKQMAFRCNNVTADVLRSLIKAYAGGPDEKTIVFCETKRDCERISHYLTKGASLHGDVSQAGRNYVLSKFKSRGLNILVTTDVAARGLDIPNVQLVIQCSPPNDIDNFIHRTGRTGRAGQSGKAVLIYHSSDESRVHECERAAQTQIERIQLPKPNLLDAINRGVKRINGVNINDAVELCGDQAKQIQKELGAVEGLSVALVLLSDVYSDMNKSLLTGEKNYRTFQFKADDPSLTKESFKEVLGSFINTLFVKGLCTNKSGDAFVFDISKDLSETVTQGIAEHLPNGVLTKLIFKLPDDVELKHINSHGEDDTFDTNEPPHRSSNFRFGNNRSKFGQDKSGAGSFGGNKSGQGYRRSYGRDYDNDNDFGGNVYSNRGQQRSSGYNNSYGASRNSYGASRNSYGGNNRRTNTFDSDDEY